MIHRTRLCKHDRSFLESIACIFAVSKQAINLRCRVKLVQCWIFFNQEHLVAASGQMYHSWTKFGILWEAAANRQRATCGSIPTGWTTPALDINEGRDESRGRTHRTVVEKVTERVEMNPVDWLWQLLKGGSIEVGRDVEQLLATGSWAPGFWILWSTV